jgi:3-oxoacyl-[acyl-carrier protein] reductase
MKKIPSIRDRFTDRTAIVTGSASGIGRQVALDFAYQGANVAVTDVDKKGMEAVAAEIRQLGGSVLTDSCDVSVAMDVQRTIDKVLNQFGSIDILVNNAGLLLSGTIEDLTNEQIDRTLDINIKGVLYFIRGVAPIMKRQRFGKIINLSSIAGKNGDSSTIFAYGASKGAVISITKSAARHLGPFNINSNAVAPHAVMTPMMNYWDEDRKKRAAELIPLRRLSTPEDISAVIVFLASEEASFINGETINVNGGYYMD